MNSNLYWIGYILGTAMVVVGILVLVGYFQLRGGAEGGGMLRTVFGIVLLLFGIYRISLATMQRRRKEREL